MKQSNMDEGQIVIEMREIVKKFGDFVANDHINLKLHKGEVLAILGENGAGKSTLMNVLYGMYRPTEGQILVNGQPVSIDNPEKAIELGIGMVHQHFMLVQPFTVTENIVLGAEPMKGLRVDLGTARQRILELSDKYNLRVDPDARVEDISVGMQQRVEILKVLYRGADILILDEPTASLTPQEIDELMEIIRNLTAAGKSILIITHKLREIKTCSDHCTIIRRGRYIDTVRVEDCSEDELAAMMVGRQVNSRVEKKQQEAGELVLEVRDLRARDYRGVEVLKGLNLEVHAGEILGLAGIDGNGQSQLVEILTGLGKATEGSVKMGGEDVVNRTPRYIFDRGISSIPEDRQKHGLVLDFSVSENLILQNFGQEPYSRHGILNKRKMREHATELIEKFDIRPTGCEERLAGQLSGGNQQKVIIAREVTNDKELLIAFNPTRGLDVGAIEFVHKYLVEQRNKGRAILLVSFELDEIMGLSDRIGVIFGGQIVGELSGREADEYQLGLMMAGGKKNRQEGRTE
ncbi:MAG: ABC transporter ATP-binding protein [Oribacterium sp.]